MVAVIERSVFDHRSLRPIDAAETKRKVCPQLMLKPGSQFIDRLRFEALIDRRRCRTQIAGVETGRDRRTQRCIDTVDVKVLVRLAVAASGSDIYVKRYRRFDESRVITEYLRFTLIPRVPRKSNSRLQIVAVVVEFKIGDSAVAARLLEVEPHTEVDLQIRERLPVVLEVCTFHIRLGLCVQRK